MLKMKNSSVSLSMLKVLRTCLAASQLTLNGAKESPWSVEVPMLSFLLQLLQNWLLLYGLSIKQLGPNLHLNVLFSGADCPQRILQNTIATSFHLQ